MAANTIPTVSTLPPAPTRADAPADFTTKADAFVAALPPLVTQVNLTVKGMNDQASYLDQLKIDTIKATGDNATAAANSAQSASDSATASGNSATQAAGYRDSAQTAAAAAQSAAGMPSISGKADFMLSVNAAGNGVEWRASVPRPTAASAGKVARVNSAGNAYELGDGSPISKYFESAKQQVVYGGSLEVIHGLGAAPKIVSLHLICNTASNGYKVGDRIEVSVATYYGPLGTGGNNNNRGCQVWCDAAKIYIKIASQSYFYGADGSFFEFNSTNFSLVARASA